MSDIHQIHESLAVQAEKMAAAKKGCAECNGPVRIPPAGDPFTSGPFIGRYRCADCWTLYWSKRPEDLADEATWEYLREEAKQIEIKRGSEVLYEEGPNRVFLSYRGTLVFDIHGSADHTHNEYDPDRFNILVRAISAISGKVPGYEVNLKLAASA